MEMLLMLFKTLIVLFGVIMFIILIMTDGYKVDVIGLIVKGLLLAVGIISTAIGVALLMDAGFSVFYGGSVGKIAITVGLALVDALFLKQVIEVLQELE